MKLFPSKQIEKFFLSKASRNIDAFINEMAQEGIVCTNNGSISEVCREYHFKYKGETIMSCKGNLSEVSVNFTGEVLLIDDDGNRFYMVSDKVILAEDLIKTHSIFMLKDYITGIKHVIDKDIDFDWSIVKLELKVEDCEEWIKNYNGFSLRKESAWMGRFFNEDTYSLLFYDRYMAKVIHRSDKWSYIILFKDELDFYELTKNFNITKEDLISRFRSFKAFELKKICNTDVED